MVGDDDRWELNGPNRSINRFDNAILYILGIPLMNLIAFPIFL